MAGIEVEAHPLLPNEYLATLYHQGKRDFARAIAAYLRRLNITPRDKQYHVLWVEKEVFPWLPFFMEERIVGRGLPLLLDYDDAIFHNYDLSKSQLVRTLLGGKIDRLMRAAAIVTVGNSYLASRAEQAGARRIEHLPTVVDLRRYVTRVAHHSERCNVGWIGTPQTASYLHLVRPALAKVSKRYGVRTILIGSGAIKLEDVPVEIHSWFENTEANKLDAMDIGIMPLPDEPWERGKCGYKLIQYMAAGIPVVASPVGVNTDIVQHGVNGFLASTPEEWEKALSQLALDPGLRARMGAAGRAMVEERYSVRTVGAKLASLIRELAAQRT